MAYFEPGREDFNYLRHLILVGGNTGEAWTKDDFSRYVTHLDSYGEADDWMFDTFAFWHFKSPKGGFLYSDINIGNTRVGEGNFYAVPAPNPGNKEDWLSVMDWYFKPGVFTHALDATIQEAEKKLGKRDYKVNLVFTIPYPGPLQTQFGEINNKKLNFSTKGQNLEKATRQRLEACVWFVDQIIRRFNQEKYKNINLLGFYWTFETVYRSWEIDDHWLLKELRKEINSRDMKFFWIPFWSSYNVHLLDDYQNYYFDCAFLQPNYMFYKNITDVKEAAHAAKQRGAGIEMEFYATIDEPIEVKDERLDRFERYLTGGSEFGYMTESACAWFDGGKAIYRLYEHHDPVEKQYYDKIYKFIKGTYH
jgi:hypothetical protein